MESMVVQLISGLACKCDFRDNRFMIEWSIPLKGSVYKGICELAWEVDHWGKEVIPCLGPFHNLFSVRYDMD